MGSQKVKKSLTNIIKYILFVLLLFGLLGGIIYLITSPTGIYVVYGSTNITSDNSGMVVYLAQGESELTLSLKNSEDWGVYSVQDCTLKVIPCVNSNNDFEFTVDGETHIFSSETDFTAAFIEDSASYDGNGLSITEDGGFSLYLVSYTEKYAETVMLELLSKVYAGSEIKISEDIDILNCPYFSLQVASPDSKTIYTIDIKFAFETLDLNETHIYF